MRFKHYEALKTFCLVARAGTISAASQELFLTKGAVSHQIKALEGELGFSLFQRKASGMHPTKKGQDLLAVARSAFDAMDRQIAMLRQEDVRTLTLGVSTYFASRWLSSRLMGFTSQHPDIRLRVQPMTDFFGFEAEGADIAIRWGDGSWTDIKCEKLFTCPAFPVAAPTVLERVETEGIEAVFQDVTLLDDRDGSTAWSEWLKLAGLSQNARQGALVIPDPNVRVQAVIDGQGLAINDMLVSRELDAGEIVRVSDVELPDYGYHLALPTDAFENDEAMQMRDWLLETSSKG